jgi:hypothetical protein
MLMHMPLGSLPGKTPMPQFSLYLGIDKPAEAPIHISVVICEGASAFLHTIKGMATITAMMYPTIISDIYPSFSNYQSNIWQFQQIQA